MRDLILDTPLPQAKFEGTGILIGSYLPNYILVVHIAPTPSEIEEGVKKDPTSKVNSNWLKEHATQTLRILPGGLQIVGYVSKGRGGDPFENQDSKLRKTMAGLFGLEKEPDEVVYLRLTKTGGIFSCRSLAPGGGDFRQMECKVSEKRLEFVRVETHVVLEVPLAIKCQERSNVLLQSHVEKAIEKHERILNDSICLWNNQIRKGSDLICPPQFESSGRKNKGRSNGDDSQSENKKPQKILVQLLYRDNLNCEDDVSFPQSNIRMKISGKVVSRSYVPAGETIDNTRKAVITDISRSLRTRVALHCDCLISEEGGEEEVESDGPITHEPPRRVFASLPDCPVTVSDYLFPGEGAEESIPAIKDLFGATITEEDIEDDLELVAKPGDLERAKKEEDMLTAKVTINFFIRYGFLLSQLFIFVVGGIFLLKWSWAYYRGQGEDGLEDTVNTADDSERTEL